MQGVNVAGGSRLIAGCNMTNLLLDAKTSTVRVHHIVDPTR
jgi:hypothetical protein